VRQPVFQFQFERLALNAMDLLQLSFHDVQVFFQTADRGENICWPEINVYWVKLWFHASDS